MITLTNPGNLTDANIVSPQGVAAALQKLYEDGGYRKSMADAAYRNATRPEFNWNVIAAEWKRLFASVLAE